MFSDLAPRLKERREKIGVVGLGYVGLPLALAFARRFDVIGYDVNRERVRELADGHDRTGEAAPEDLKNSGMEVTADPARLSETRFIVAAVPTPVDSGKRPALGPLLSACETIGEVIRPGTVAVFESTVYPGVTEEKLIPVIEGKSGLAAGRDFRVGYSPERINPGDREHTIEKIVKIVSGQDAETLKIVSEIYGEIVEAGVHEAPSIKVAEAAKVIENIQRDINIALVNELSMIFNLMGIRTADVLEAAATKWNFVPFSPGLVGGHCIGVDPYYLTSKAEQLGYHPHMILSGRRINDGMGKYVAEQVVKRLNRAGKAASGARVGIFGITFKENVPDIRNSKAPDIHAELRDYGAETLVYDPVAPKDDLEREYGITLSDMEAMRGLDAAVIAVRHNQIVELGPGGIKAMLNGGRGVVADIKSAFNERDFGDGVIYWSL